MVYAIMTNQQHVQHAHFLMQRRALYCQALLLLIGTAEALQAQLMLC
jgi:hypothetical protein